MKRFLFVVPILLLLAASSPTTSQTATAAPFIMETYMYGDQQLPPINTVVYGFVRFFFNDSRTEAEYTVDVKGINGTNVTSADLHRGAKGVRGPVVRHLADGGFITTGGRMSFTQADLNEMAAGNYYVTLSTTEHPDGAIRGQIVLPANFFPGQAAVPTPAVVLAEPVTQPAVSVPPVQAIAQPLSPPSVVQASQAVRITPPNTGDGGLVSP